MDIWIVVCTSGEYSYQEWWIDSAWTNEQLARERATYLSACPADIKKRRSDYGNQIKVELYKSQIDDNAPNVTYEASIEHE